MTAGIGSAGMPGLFGLLLAMEAGVPVPGALASARPRTHSESEVAP